MRPAASTARPAASSEASRADARTGHVSVPPPVAGDRYPSCLRSRRGHARCSVDHRGGDAGVRDGGAARGRHASGRTTAWRRSSTSRSASASASSVSWRGCSCATRAGAGAPGTVILKMPSQFPENRAVGDHFNFYEREGRFYSSSATSCRMRTPRCYWNHIDPDADTLRAAPRGPRRPHDDQPGGGRREPNGPPQALARSRVLHGAWWASPALDGLDWMPRLDDPINLAAGQQYRDAWPLFVERVGDALPAARGRARRAGAARVRGPDAAAASPRRR